MSLPTPENIKSWISENLPCTHIEVAGDGHHFEVFIVSDAFESLSRVRRHQLVYRALGERMVSDIHALSIRALAPTEWQPPQG